jgi:hypothetical protein
MRRLEQLIALACLAAAAGGCAPAPQGSRDKPTRGAGEVLSRTPPPQRRSAPKDTVPDARVALARLEREARALVRTEGCPTTAGCRTAPVGWRGCGGPRTYLVYCAASTDTARLLAKLRELEAAERAYNAESGMMSTCEFRSAPTARAQGGSCREGPAGAAPAP